MAVIEAPETAGARDTLLDMARRLREGRQVSQALAVLDQLAALEPGFSRLHHERGHCLVLLGDAVAAIAALREAVRLNPMLPASWDMLAQLLRLQGETDAAAVAARNVAILHQLPRAVVVAGCLQADGDLARAEAVIRDYLARDVGNVGAHLMLARIRRDLGDDDDAESLLAAVLDQAPDYHQARFDYAALLLKRQKHAQARDEVLRLLGVDSGNRDYLKLYGAACIGLGDHEPVIDLYARLLDSTPSMGTEAAELHLWRGNALKVTGRQSEAISGYHAALAARADYGVAWFSLANLKTYRFSDREIGRMSQAEADPAAQEMDRIYLCFALGKAHEDRADYATAWHYYQRGNALRQRSGHYRLAAVEACRGQLTQLFTADFFAARADWGVTDTAPIFVVGLPRSGSTLVEQILASHSNVEGTQELTEIGRYVNALCGNDPDCGLPLTPAAIGRLSAADVLALGERFLQETRAYRRLGRPFFIDKMPNNFWHVGFIHLILPRAVIIDVRREPMACCFSNFKQLFGTVNQPFSYSLEDVAGYYRAYVDVMRHWDSVLPGRVLRVQYEDLVEDLDGSVRRLLAHCGLTFEPACLTFHQTLRSVRTPSSEQVRQPIGRDGLMQWSHFEPWLAPLRTALGEVLTRHRS